MIRNLFLALSIVLLSGQLTMAQNNSLQPQAGVKTSSYKGMVFKGNLLAEELSKTTGIALNPLLCISALGAYSYFQTPVDQRSGLPWHCSPKFWGPLALVMGLIFLKDSSKVAVPKLLMIPLDAIETLVEKNTSALLALPVLFSLVSSGGFEQTGLLVQQAGQFFLPAALAGNGMEAVANSGGLLPMLATYLTVLVIFVVVWVLSQAFNVLILLCPFSFIDVLLATARNGLIALVAGLSGTPFGVALSLLIILVSVYLFPRTVRFVVFGTVISFDIVLYRLSNKRCQQPQPEKGISCFTSSYLNALPPLTYGKLRQKDGLLRFSYKRLYLFGRRRVILQPRATECELVSGLLSPLVYQQPDLTKKREDEPASSGRVQLFRIRGCYCQHLPEIAELLAIRENKEISIAGKIKEGISWLASLLRRPERVAVRGRG